MSTIFKKGEFIDYAGKTHKYTIAGVVLSFPQDKMFATTYDRWFDEDYAPIYKVISIGISICNPGDKYSDLVGEKQSEGRAIKYHDRIIAMSKGGICTPEAVQFFVDQTAANLESTPALFIPGYGEAAKKYLNKTSK